MLKRPLPCLVWLIKVRFPFDQLYNACLFAIESREMECCQFILLMCVRGGITGPDPGDDDALGLELLSGYS